MKSLLAQQITEYPLGEIGGPKEEGWGPWATGIETISKAAGAFTTIISNTIGVMTIAAGIWFMFQFIIGGFNWLTAGGNRESISAAQSRLTNAFIGLIVVVGAYGLIYVIGELLGFRILQPQELIKLVGP